MATIYRIAPPTAPRRSGTSASTGSAEIILFPGVRYERWEDTAAKQPTDGRRAKARDRLDLLD